MTKILGLMSGTSADGVDAVLLDLSAWPKLGASFPFPTLTGPTPRARVLEHQAFPYSPELRAAVLRAIHDQSSPRELTQLHWALGAFYAACARPLAGQADAIACHGQTVQHHPRADPGRGWNRPATLQLGAMALIAEQTGRPVVADFRSADLAAGGVGAPLVPFADWALFAEADRPRLLLNIGGIANLTFLPSLDPHQVVAFDIGPGNCLIDEAAARAGQPCDWNGALAASGQIDQAILEALLTHPELSQAPPKATGREVWNLAALGALVPFDQLSVPDLAATVTAFTVCCLTRAIQSLNTPPSEIVVAGGGACNPVLMRRFRAAVPQPVHVLSETPWAELGWTEQAREAAAFAFLGYCRLQNWPGTLPQVTGARRAVCTGTICPAEYAED